MKQHERVTLAAAAAGAVLSLALPGIGPSRPTRPSRRGSSQIPPRHGGVDLRAPSLVEQGRRLFEEETFGGNGRTCASCHPASNNFTIDVPYINTLPADDPLFVAEFNPALKDLEIPGLLRGKGLICENLDGFDRPGAARSAHTLALGLSRAPDRVGAFDLSPLPPGIPAARPIFPRRRRRVGRATARRATGPCATSRSVPWCSISRRPSTGSRAAISACRPATNSTPWRRSSSASAGRPR